MGKFSKTGFGRSLSQAWRGLLYVWKTEGHLQFHILAGSIVILTAWWLRLTRWEWFILIFAIGSVITAEVMNTAVELVVDLVEPNFHPLAGMAKDVAAGAVLVAAIQSVVIGIGIFGPRLWRWFEVWTVR